MLNNNLFNAKFTVSTLSLLYVFLTFGARVVLALNITKLFHLVYLLLTFVAILILATNIKCLLILLRTTIFCITLG